jgi:outer membrane autotransporter protein
MTKKHIKMTNRTATQLPYILACAIAAFLGLSGVAQGQFEEFGKTFCRNPNAAAVGAALDSARGDPRMDVPRDAKGRTLFELLDFKLVGNQPELCDLLDERIPAEEFTAVFTLGFSQANIQTDNLSRRMLAIRTGSGSSATGFTINSGVSEFSMGLAGPTGPEGKSGPSVIQPTPQNRWGFFVTGIGEFTKVDDTSVAHGYYLPTGGVIFGADYRVSPNFAIGLTGGYAHTSGDLLYTTLDVDGGTVGAYATAFAGGFYINAAATGVFNDYESHRDALLGDAQGDTNGRDFNGLVAAGYEWKSGGLTIGPTVSYQYTYVEFDGFTEHGSLLPLTFNDQNAESSRTALGAKISYDWHVGHILVRPEFRAAWQHEFDDTANSIVASFANGAGNSFTVDGPEIGRDSLLIGAGAAVIFNDRFSVYAYYDGELARSNYSSNNVSAGVRVSF